MVPDQWMRNSIHAIVSRDGTLLAECMTRVCALDFFSNSPLTTSVDIPAEVGSLRKHMLATVDLNQSDAVQYVEVLCRIVMARFVFLIASKNHDSDASNKLFFGLLFAFDALQEVHMSDRSRWNPRTNVVGWDTVALIMLVHMVQDAARKATELEDAVNQLVRNWRKLFIFMQSTDPQVPSEQSRRRGALAVVNGLLSILFQQNNTHQCRVLLNTIEASERAAENASDSLKSILRPASHLVAEVVKFRYYQGRMKLYEKDFHVAFSSLQEAYSLLPAMGRGANAAQSNNKLRIHFHLLVAGVACGLQPPQEVLDADSVCRRIFTPLLLAMTDGNAILFSKLIDEHGTILKRRGAYMILHQARLLCYLFLLQKVHVGLCAAGIDSSRIPLMLVVSAAKFVSGADALQPDDVALSPERELKRHRVESESLEVDSIALWIARLISREFVKGYVSYEHKMLVLSKQTPFPSLSR